MDYIALIFLWLLVKLQYGTVVHSNRYSTRLIFDRKSDNTTILGFRLNYVNVLSWLTHWRIKIFGLTLRIIIYLETVMVTLNDFSKSKFRTISMPLWIFIVKICRIYIIYICKSTYVYKTSNLRLTSNQSFMNQGR